MNDKFAMFLVALVVVVVLALGIWASREDAKNCHQAGGEIVTKPVSGFGITTSGQLASTFSTISFCVSADGRILR